MAAKVDGEDGKLLLVEVRPDRLVGWFIPHSSKDTLRCVWTDGIKISMDNYNRSFVEVQTKGN